MKWMSLALIATIVSMPAMATDYSKTICGSTDDRTPSQDPKIARVLQRNATAGCTLTLIGKSCAVSAGHCTSTFDIAQFNTPESANGRIQAPKAEDVYTVDRTSIVYKDGGIGNDWAVLRLLPNEITGELPGDAQGFYPIAYEMPNIGDMVRITGYGAAYNNPTGNFAQQTHTGPIADIARSGARMGHQVDTMGGNSGSTIRLEATGEIIGIHTHGGCGSWGGSNGSTLLPRHEEFKAAIKACLDYEAQNM